MRKQRTLTSRAIAVLIAAVLVCLPWLYAYAAAENRDQPLPLDDAAQDTADTAQDADDGDQTSQNQRLDFDTSVLNDSMTVQLIDADSGEILFEKDPDRRIYPASTTKIMTGLLAIELNGGTLDGEVTLGSEVNEFSSTSSLLGLKQNYTISIKDLVYGLMLVSGNDAAAALAVHFGGSVDGFVALMNQKAQELGMTNTVFGNPHGLDQRSIDIDHYSTAADMAKLAKAAYENPLLMEVMGTQTYEITTTELNDNIRSSTLLHNGNYLLETPEQEPQRSRYAQYRYQPTTGMKTGLLQNVDGQRNYGCLVASASKDGRNLIATIFADTSDYGDEGPALDRWRTAIALFEYGFTGFVEVDLAPYILDYETSVQVESAASNDPEKGMLTVNIAPGLETSLTVSLARRDASELTGGNVQLQPVLQIQDGLAAPITAGQTVGSVMYQLNGQDIVSVPLVAARSVYSKGDENVTSEHYGVPNPTGIQWWTWLIIIGAAAGVLLLVYVLLQRRRYSGRHIGKHRRSRLRYPRAWDDDTPLSALRGRRDRRYRR